MTPARRRRRLLLPLLLLAACDGEPATSDPPPAAPPPETSATSATVSATVPGVPRVVYSVQNIATLQPTLPGHAVKTPAPTARTPQLEQALARLTTIVDTHAGDPDNPWAIGHGLIARGEGWKLRDGSDAVDHLFSTYAEPLPAGDTVLLRFPASRGSIRIQPHAELMLKMLTEAGVSPDRQVTVAGQSHPVMDLYRGSLLSSYLDPQKNHSSYASTDDIAWALQGLSAWAPPGLVWVSLDSTPMSMDSFAAFAVAVLAQETQPIAQAMAVGADFERKGQGIFNYTCGGAHLLQGTAFALARGFGTDQARTLFTAQVELSFYRLPRELAIYDAAMKRFGETESLRLLVQRLKFTGHFLESMHKLAAMGFYTPTPEQTEALDGVALQVALTLEALSHEGVFERMDTIRAEDEQIYLDLVGDSAHALHALHIALGDEPVHY